MNRHLLAAILGATFVLAACSRPEPPPEPLRAVRTVTVGSTDAGGELEFAGEVRARTETRLGFRVSGKLVQRPVDPGQQVKAGQLLAALDPQDLRLNQDAARAALAAARSAHALAEADFRRFKELRDQGFIGAAEFERREATLKSAQAQLDQAQAQAAVQGNQAGYASLVADRAGTITAVEAEPGMVVAAGTPVLRLAHDGPRDVVFSVPEDQVTAIQALAATPGRIQVRLWGDEHTALPARVREVSAAADPLTRTFQIKADIGDASKLRLGQTATVRVELPRTVGVTKLPLSALKEQGGASHVWLVDPASMTVQLQPVGVLGAEGNEAVIGTGLKPGQVVVTAGVHVLTPGQKVKFYVDPTAAGSSTLSSPATPVRLK
ncbi:MAG: efflux RND transporter periplasmic adaptor subunit [Burkholderiales bacterium]|nr:efflux RND transporter periplasmic adaptor subunit [Burkholderiales bacterium]